jgi:hypothetical protein
VNARVDIPVYPRNASTLNIPFSVIADGPQYVELGYPHGTTPDVMADLNALTGSCTLRENGESIATVALPTTKIIGGNDLLGTILIEFNGNRRRQYSVDLHTKQIPHGLEKGLATLRIEPDPRRFKTVVAALWLSYVAGFASILCAIALLFTLLFTRTLGRRWGSAE